MISSSLSSITYLFLSTTPLLILFLYFLYLSLQRPAIIAQQYEDDNEEDKAPLITLESILYTFLATLILWSSLFIYLKSFVPKRRALMQKYASEDSGNTRVVGDVYYEEPKGCGRLCNKMNHTDLAYVTYRHLDDGKYVQKTIRTYHAYHREKVAVILLPGLPLSGLPLEDVERDVLSYQRYVLSSLFYYIP